MWEAVNEMHIFFMSGRRKHLIEEFCEIIYANVCVCSFNECMINCRFSLFIRWNISLTGFFVKENLDANFRWPVFAGIISFVILLIFLLFYCNIIATESSSFFHESKVQQLIWMLVITFLRQLAGCLVVGITMQSSNIQRHDETLYTQPAQKKLNSRAKAWNAKLHLLLLYWSENKTEKRYYT